MMLEARYSLWLPASRFFPSAVILPANCLARYPSMASAAATGAETRADTASRTATRPRTGTSLTPGMVGTMNGRLEHLLRDAFPDASELSVVDRTGGGDHIQVPAVGTGLAGPPRG